MLRIAVLDDYQDLAHTIADWSPLGDVEVHAFIDHIADEGELVDHLQPYDVLIAMRERTRLHDSVFARLPRLRLLVTTGGKTSAIDVAAAEARGIAVAHAPGERDPSHVVEHTWGLIIGAARHIAEEDRRVRAGGWMRTLGTSLRGSTLGVVGLGRLGSRVGAVARAFGMEIVAWSPHLTDERAAACGAVRVTKDELFQRADVVTIHMKLSDATRGLVGARELALMKPTAILVNTSRGPLVDERALLDSLERHAIAGAALDVFDVEPLPLDHPLRRLENALVTPHLGGVTRPQYASYFRQAVSAIGAFVSGRDPSR